MDNNDVYYKKNVQFNYRNCNLNFRVSQSLFSSFSIDNGTQRLLRTLTSEGLNNFNKILDLGCGYGPLGISLKSVNRNCVVHMVDRDALALKYSCQNAKLNSANDIKIYSSLGYDDIKDVDFDLILSNIPAKAGEPIISHLLKDVRFHLQPKGRVAIVVIDAIKNYVIGQLADQGINILFRKAWPGHVVIHYSFSNNTNMVNKPDHSDFEMGVYDRKKIIITFKGIKIPIITVYGISEFDTLNYETELLMSGLKILEGRVINKAVIFNPKQGIIPVALTRSATVRKIILVDRDLLSLRNSKRNLVINGYSSTSIFQLHQEGISQTDPNNADCIIGVLSEKEESIVHAMYVRQAAQQMASEGLLLLASSSTAITRIETLVKTEKLLDVVDRWRLRGKSIIILKNK